MKLFEEMKIKFLANGYLSIGIEIFWTYWTITNEIRHSFLEHSKMLAIQQRVEIRNKIPTNLINEENCNQPTKICNNFILIWTTNKQTPLQ